jgi:hypothetical protein
VRRDVRTRRGDAVDAVEVVEVVEVVAVVAVVEGVTPKVLDASASGACGLGERPLTSTANTARTAATRIPTVL